MNRFLTGTASLVIALATAVVYYIQSNARANGVLQIKKPVTVVDSKQGRTEDPGWPSLSDFLDEDTGEVVGDVQMLLDFAIVGHTKTAASTVS